MRSRMESGYRSQFGGGLTEAGLSRSRRVVWACWTPADRGDGGEVTGDAGLLLIRKADEPIDIVRLARNRRIEPLASWSDSAPEACEPTGQGVRCFGEVAYRAGTWRMPRRVLLLAAAQRLETG